MVVYQVKDTIFWKQITTMVHCKKKQHSLFIKSKIQFFESKSQRWKSRNSWNESCLSSQRYNFLKANHNELLPIASFKEVVYQVKDTIFWKQITTWTSPILTFTVLFIKSKIQFFESKSQPDQSEIFCEVSCLSSQRYNFLKANHNWNV